MKTIIVDFIVQGVPDIHPGDRWSLPVPAGKYMTKIARFGTQVLYPSMTKTTSFGTQVPHSVQHPAAHPCKSSSLQLYYTAVVPVYKYTYHHAPLINTIHILH